MGTNTTPKKKDSAATDENVVEVKKEEPKAEPTSTGLSPEALQEMIAKAVASAVAEQKKESDQKIAELEERLALKEGKSSPHTPSASDITLVYLSDSPGVINRVPGVELVCGHYGENFTLPRYQFDAIVGQYRHWFDQGILAVSRDNIDVAAKKGLKTEDEYYLKPKVLEKIGTMPVDELKKLWNNCVNDNERLCIVMHYKRKFIEGKEPGYRETDRVLAMNSLTNQGLKREAIEISGASLKIGQTDF